MRVLYLRQSKDTDGNELAVSRQRAECQQWAASHGWTIGAEYVDNDVSASKGKRPEYTRLLSDIASGTVTGVLAWDLDRLHRQPSELEHFITLADTHHIALATVAGETDLSTDQGRLVARLKGAVARAEIERKSARHKAANRQAAEAGDLQPKIRPFGWVKTVEANGKVHFNHLDVEESAAIKSAATDIINGTRSMASVIKDWNANGPLTSKGKMWTNDSFRKMMARARNAGLQSYNGKIVGPATCEAIITESQYELLQELFKGRVKQVHSTARVHAFSGIPVCADCGGLMYVTHIFVTGKTYYNYLCKKCQNNSISKTVLDYRIRHSLKFALGDTHAAAGALGQGAILAELNRARADLKVIEDEASEIMKADIALTDRLNLLAGIKDRRNAAETKVQSLQNSNRIARLLDGLMQPIGPRYVDFSYMDEIMKRFDALSVEDQNLVTREMLSVSVAKSPRKGMTTRDERDARINIKMTHSQ